MLQLIEVKKSKCIKNKYQHNIIILIKMLIIIKKKKKIKQKLN